MQLKIGNDMRNNNHHIKTYTKTTTQGTQDIGWKTLHQEKKHPCCSFTALNILLSKMCILHRFVGSD